MLYPRYYLPGEPKRMEGLMQHKLQSIILVVIFLLAATSIQAAIITVGSGGCTLNDAIRAANSDNTRGNCPAGSGADLIRLPNNFNLVTSDTLPTIESPMTITTISPTGLAKLDGNDDHRILHIVNANDVTLKNLVLANGKIRFVSSTTGGAAILISGSEVSLENVTLHDNIVRRGLNRTGGAIHASNSVLNIENSIFTQNQATPENQVGLSVPAKGGSLALYNSTAIINNSTFDGYIPNLGNSGGGDPESIRTSAERGGGIYIDNSNVTIGNSYFEEHSLGGFDPNMAGEDLYITNNSVVWVFNSTFFHAFLNNGNRLGDRIYIEDSDIHFNNTTILAKASGGFSSDRGIVLKNSNIFVANSIFWRPNDGADIYEFCAALDAGNNPIPFPPLSQDINNLFPEDQSCSGPKLNYSDDVSIADPEDNGGPTKTARLRTVIVGNEIIPNIAANNGDSASCEQTDQRGEQRGPNCDIGAYEITDISDLEVDMRLLTPPPYFSNQLLEYEIAVTNLGTADVYGVTVNIGLQGLNLESYQTVSSCNGLNCEILGIVYGGTSIIRMFARKDLTPSFDADVLVSTVNAGYLNDPDPTNNIDNTNNGGTTVAAAELRITQNLQTPAPYNNGQTIGYQIEVTNNGSANASNVAISVNPTGLNIISFGACDSVSGNVCTINYVNNGSSRTVSMLATISANKFKSRVSVSANEYDPISYNNTAVNANTIAADSDLKLAMNLLDTPPYYPGQLLEFSIGILNSGPDVATNVTINSIGENFFVSSFADTQYCSILPCVIPAIAVNDTVEIIAQGYAPFSPVAFSHQVDVWSDQNDPTPNSAVDGGTVSPTADLEIAANRISTGPFYVNEVVEFELRVHNNGVLAATAVEISAILDFNMELLSVESPYCSSLPCTLPGLEVGVNNTEVIKVLARIVQAGQFRIRANVDALEFDELEYNNNASANGFAELVLPENIFSDSFE